MSTTPVAFICPQCRAILGGTDDPGVIPVMRDLAKKAGIDMIETIRLIGPEEAGICKCPLPSPASRFGVLLQTSRDLEILREGADGKYRKEEMTYEKAKQMAEMAGVPLRQLNITAVGLVVPDPLPKPFTDPMCSFTVDWLPDTFTVCGEFNRENLPHVRFGAIVAQKDGLFIYPSVDNIRGYKNRRQAMKRIMDDLIVPAVIHLTRATPGRYEKWVRECLAARAAEKDGNA